jgi:NAD(P)H-hydrate repair Nnr-like enzyme with NAD(P)H-hydrate epimerase domain
MELAGLSVAQAIQHANENYHNKKWKKIIVICGPGSFYFFLQR